MGIILFCAVVVSIFIHNRSVDDVLLHEDSDVTEQNEIAKHGDNETAKIDSLPRDAKTASNEETYADFINIPSLRSGTMAFCGRDEEGIDQSISSVFRNGLNEQVDSLTSTQIEAIEKIYQKCGHWYSFVAEHDEYNLRELTGREHELDKLLSINSFTEQNIGYARELAGSEDSKLSTTALAILLSRDQEFQYSVAKSVGSNDRNYAMNAMLPLFVKHACLAEKDCGPNSMTMLSQCIANKSACGLSVNELLYSQHSPQYVDDIIGMSHAIPKIINDMQRSFLPKSEQEHADEE